MTPEELERLPWEEVRSSNVGRLAFEPADVASSLPCSPGLLSRPPGTMYVEFFSDGEPSVYRYFDVPWEAFEKVRDAHSVGGMLAKIVKGRYRYEAIELEEEAVPADVDVLEALDRISERLDAIQASVENVERMLIGARRAPRTHPTREETHVHDCEDPDGARGPVEHRRAGEGAGADQPPQPAPSGRVV